MTTETTNPKTAKPWSDRRVRRLLASRMERMVGSRVRRVTSFADAGVLTNNEGLVVTMSDGKEFQISVIRSR